MASCRGAAVGEERLSVDQPALVVVGRQLQQGGLVTFELSRDGLVLLGVSGRQQPASRGPLKAVMTASTT
jgi:hypothetical protein